MKTPSSDLPLDDLARKLGIREGMTVVVLNPPVPYESFFTRLPSVRLTKDPAEPADLIHLFATTFQALEAGLEKALPRLKPTGMLWVSWPRQTSGMPSEVGKMDVLLAGQATGLVDVKVASVDATWSGHKFVVPKALRP